MISLKTSHSLALHLLVLLVAVTGRSLPRTATTSFSGRENNLVADGNDIIDQYNHNSHYDNRTSLLLLPSSRDEFDELSKPSSSSSSSHDDESNTSCEQMYGFLPCSNNMFGHIFLIVVYEYLLFHGESYLIEGSERIFKILGPGVFGATAFHVLGALPESLLLLASVLLNTKEKAEEYVLNTGVGLVTGSSILLLTLVWATCVIVGRQDFSKNTSASSNNTIINNNNNIVSSTTTLSLPFKRLRAFLTGCGITTDSETSYLARIMIFSAIPFVIMEIPSIFKIYSWDRIAILIALFVSLVFLLLYFVYQVFQPWIQQRRLEYVKHAHFISTILQHVQKRALGRLLTHNGAPNVDAIRRLFDEIDEDRDNFVSASEVKALFFEINRFKAQVDKEQAIVEVMEKFDLDGDRRITKEEFESGLIKWLSEVKYAVDQGIFSPRSLQDISRVFRPWLQKSKRRERQIRMNSILEVLKNCQTNGMQNLTTEDGRPSLQNIRRLFEEFDRDNDNFISQIELREGLSIKLGTIPMDVNEAVDKLMQELDKSGDNLISDQEFVMGLMNLLNSTTQDQASDSWDQSEDDIYQRTWEETDKLMEEENNKGTHRDDSSPKAWAKAIMYLVVGVIILSLLAEPLVESVQSFSESAGIPSFFISFILVPLATNARAATSAISMASRRTPRTTSLTFSEIYGGVFMNNILGFSVLLSLIYFREMAWELSAEILVVLLVCLAVGIIASFRFKFALWTAILAYLLYPSSLLLVYLFNHVLHYT